MMVVSNLVYLSVFIVPRAHPYCCRCMQIHRGQPVPIPIAWVFDNSRSRLLPRGTSSQVVYHPAGFKLGHAEQSLTGIILRDVV